MAVSISSEKASQIAHQFYGISGNVTKLPGDVDENFNLESVDGKNYILKISKDEVNLNFLDFQTEILKHLAGKNLECHLPTVILNNEHAFLSTFTSEANELRTIRLLSWIDGRLWARVNPKTSDLRNHLGRQSGKITAALKDFDHSASHRDFDWDLANASWTERHIDYFNASQQKFLTYFQELFVAMQPVFTKLPKSVIHNDVNDYNILVSNDLRDHKVQGIIDFGDAIYTQTISDLAVVLAYAIMDVPDPLAAAVDVIQGYHQQSPISEKELECLYTLVAMRLVISVTKSSIRKNQTGATDYHVISEKPAWDLLEKWYGIHPNFALYNFRVACNYSAHPLSSDFEKWTTRNKISLHTLFPTLTFDSTQNIDMSVGSVLLGTSSDYNDPEISTFKINQYQNQHSDKLLTNGYLEIRPFYTTDAFKSEGNSGPQYRTTHLGTDFWVKAQTPIHAPYDGYIAILHHNDYNKDYGPMVVIEHTVDNIIFYTLYGHLTLSTLELLKVGQKVKQGEHIGNVGEFHENGNWVPHLHFQVLLDLLGNANNFPGVAFPSEKAVWRSICPDPAFLFSETITPSEAKNSEEDMTKFRKEHMGKGLSLSYSKPLHIARGEGVYLIDSEGKKYLDTANNVNHVGHQHPEVVKAGQEQMAILNTNTRYLHENLISYAEALLRKLPKELSVLHFVNSGSEANELALRMAKTITGQTDFLAIEVGYHGNTNSAMDVSSYKFDGKGGSGKPHSTHILPLPDPFRGKHTGENCGSEYARYAKRHIDHLKVIDEGIAGFIGESMISCGGQIMPPKNYFKEVYEYVRAAGGLCIADEVQTGFGRMGKTFWAFELYDVIPDIVTMGKPAGNGHALAIVACTPEVASRFNTGMEYFNTFGGNPVSCAIGKSVLDIIEKEKLQENALETGAYLKSELALLQKKFPIIGDVRGEGLFLGIELTTLEKNPLPEHAAYLADRMKDLGILMSTDGPDYNVLKIKPPMVFSKENAQELIFRLQSVFVEDFMLHY